MVQVSVYQVLMTCGSGFSKRGQHHMCIVFLVVLLEFRAVICRMKTQSAFHWLYLAMVLLKALFWSYSRVKTQDP
jgi:hypothetical protein